MPIGIAMPNSQSGVPVVIAPSGDTSGATDTRNINAALSSQGTGATIQLEAGVFYINEPIVVPPFETLQAAVSSGLIGTIGCGTVLETVAGFSAGKRPVAAAILLVGHATDGLAALSQEQHVLHVISQITTPAATSHVSPL